MPNDSIKLFISYAHEDEAYFKAFDKGLKNVIINTEHFEWSVWSDKNIHIGNFWEDEIQNNIKDCNVAMLLVSVGFMASKYIKEKEFTQFIERYKEKGILIIPVMFAPCDFNRWDDLGKLQFFKPKGSTYGKAEIEDFTYADLIFNERDVAPNPNIARYHLDLVKKVEESFKEFLQKVRVEETKEVPITQTSNLNRLSDFPKPSNLFTGRKKEISEFKNTFDSFRIFAIEGLGGTGKTQFVAKCIEELIHDKDKIIWLNGSAQSNFDVFVETAGYGDVLKGEKKSDLAMYSGFKDLIERDERTIFLDNFNDYEDPAFSKFLSFAQQYLHKATIILVTKTEPAIDGITSLPVIRLEGLENDALDYAKKFKFSNSRYTSISESDLEKICNGTDGHPLAIEFSMWLMGYGKRSEDIMAHMPEFSGLKKVEEFSKRLFLDIFNHSKTSDQERDCFLKCSVFKERITEDEVQFLFDGKDIFYLLAGLMDKLLITLKDGLYEIHPLVRSFSYEKLENKLHVHKKAAEFFITKRKEKLNPSLEEKIFYHLSEAQAWEIIADSVETMGENFIQQGQLGLINDFMNRSIHSGSSRPIFEIFFGDIAQIKGEWDKALIHFGKASQNTEQNYVRAEGMIKYGEVLYKKGDIKASLTYFEKGYEFAKIYSFRKVEARALDDIGSVYFDFAQPDIAYEKSIAALAIRKEINDIEGIATSYNNIANILDYKGLHGKALEQYNESIKLTEKIEDRVGLGATYCNIGTVLRHQRKLDAALHQTELALKINEEIGHKEGIGHALNEIGIILREQRRFKESLSNFMKSLSVREEIGDKIGIIGSFTSIGVFYLKTGVFDKSLYHLFTSFSLSKQKEIKAGENVVVDWISHIRDKLGKTKFKELAVKVYNDLDLEIQKPIQLKDFFDEPQTRQTPKIGRNDICPCGSGKKYKHCHGAN